MCCLCQYRQGYIPSTLVLRSLLLTRVKLVIQSATLILQKPNVWMVVELLLPSTHIFGTVKPSRVVQIRSRRYKTYLFSSKLVTDSIVSCIIRLFQCCFLCQNYHAIHLLVPRSMEKTMKVTTMTMKITSSRCKQWHERIWRQHWHCFCLWHYCLSPGTWKCRSQMAYLTKTRPRSNAIQMLRHTWWKFPTIMLRFLK